MKIIEYHSTARLQVALSNIPLLERIIYRLRVQWIRIRFNIPLLLRIQEHQSQENEYSEWNYIENNSSFHATNTTSSSSAWNVKQVIKEMYEEEHEFFYDTFFFNFFSLTHFILVINIMERVINSFM